jgi:hypothetical protein
MKKVIYLFITILTIWMAQGCQTDDEARATGEVKVSILADPSLSTTRAQMTPAQAIDLDVIDENQTVVKSFKDAAATGVGTFALPVGTYVFHAYSANKNSSTPYFDADNAYYEDRDTVVVTAGSMQDVSLVCTLAMSKVSVNYSDALKTNFTQLDCTVSGPAGSLLYNKEETRAGYFPASGTLLITLNVTNVKGNSFSTQQEIIASTSAWPTTAPARASSPSPSTPPPTTTCSTWVCPSPRPTRWSCWNRMCMERRPISMPARARTTTPASPSNTD